MPLFHAKWRILREDSPGRERAAEIAVANRGPALGIHDVVSGWSGLKNGALIDAAESAGFDLFITADQEIRYQQNLTGRKISVLVLSTNNWGLIQTRAGIIGRAIDAIVAGSHQELLIPEG